MVEAGFTFVLLLTTCIGYREVAVASFRTFINDHHHHHLTYMYRGGGACFYSICSLPSNLALPNLPRCASAVAPLQYLDSDEIREDRSHLTNPGFIITHHHPFLPGSKRKEKKDCSMIHHTARGYRKLPTTYMYLLPPTSDVTSPDNNI